MSQKSADFISIQKYRPATLFSCSGVVELRSDDSLLQDKITFRCTLNGRTLWQWLRSFGAKCYAATSHIMPWKLAVAVRDNETKRLICLFTVYVQFMLRNWPPSCSYVGASPFDVWRRVPITASSRASSLMGEVQVCVRNCTCEEILCKMAEIKIAEKCWEIFYICGQN